MATLTSIALLLASLTLVHASVGPCRYDPELCSCKMGASNQGVCWDKIPGDPVNCKARTCKPGWTCACGGRTHVCYVGNLTAEHNTGAPVTLSEVISSQGSNTVTFSIRQQGSPVRQQGSPVTRPCAEEVRPTATGPEISLGTIEFGISEIGALENQCNILAWFHNGVLMGNYKKPVSVTRDNLGSILEERRDHQLLELRPGDLIAFRFKDASYYCYRHITKFLIDGRSLDSTAPGFSTRFAREHTDNWEHPNFKPVLAEKETKDNLAAFVPLRPRMVPPNENSTTFGPEIVPGSDIWEAPKTPQDENHKISNFYFRIQFPATLPPVEV